jgi:hypothetical protein
MNSHSEASRPPVFDIIASIGVIIVVVLVSKLLRERFPAPSGNAWLWIAAAVGVWAPYRASVKRRASAVRGTLIFAALYLAIQIVVQALVGFGIVRF